MSEQFQNSRTASVKPAPFTNKNDDNRLIPERQVYSRHERPEWNLNGQDITITGGFMEKFGHGRKRSSTAYLDSQNPDPNKPAMRAPGNYNIGIDYVIAGKDKRVEPWYPGVVTKAGLAGGYGYSVTVKTNQSYVYQGVSYPIHNTYSHLAGIDKNITVGAAVTPNTALGKMGGTGIGGRNTYAEHVDFQSYIEVNGRRIQISPNLMQDNLKQQQVNGTLNGQSNDIHLENAQKLVSSKLLQTQYRSLLQIYSSDGTSTGHVDLPNLIQGLKTNNADPQTIAAVVADYFESKGVSAAERAQKIAEAFDNINQKGNNDLVSVGQSANGLERR